MQDLIEAIWLAFSKNQWEIVMRAEKFTKINKLTTCNKTMHITISHFLDTHSL